MAKKNWRTPETKAKRQALRRATSLHFDLRKPPSRSEKFALIRYKTKISKILSGEYIARKPRGAKRPVLVRGRKHSFGDYLHEISWFKAYDDHSHKLALVGRNGKLIYPQVSGRRWAMALQVQITQSHGYYDLLRRFKNDFNVVDDSGKPIPFAADQETIERALEVPGDRDRLEYHSP